VQIIVTPCAIVDGVRSADVEYARSKFGARIISEGSEGKLLLRVDTLVQLEALMDGLRQRDVGAVSPNFLRFRVRGTPSQPRRTWAHGMIGVRDAWELTRGDPSISVAILDEGVDTAHPCLKPAIIAERDFIGGGGNSAMPDGDDAHGTACAGIVVSRGKRYPGIAPDCSLIAARIGMSDGSKYGWVFDDFATADAIDWCWKQGAAALSNSWGGDVPSDSISRALGRARTQGRSGLGSVVCIAAGNDQDRTDFPGRLPDFVTVGASNWNDERKTHKSSDGEPWGSNFGPTLTLLAPGVAIATTDISGARGYASGDFTTTFNGTSAATPHVAAAAALMLSVRPDLTAAQVRRLLVETADPIGGQTGWTRELGHGRLNVAAAVRAAAALARKSTKRA
jgi:subtilisin family serine protease